MKISKLAIDRLENKINAKINNLIEQWESKNVPKIKELKSLEALEMAMNDPAWIKKQIQRSKDCGYVSIETCDRQMERDCKAVMDETTRRNKIRKSWDESKSKMATELRDRGDRLMDNIIIGKINLDEGLIQIQNFK